MLHYGGVKYQKAVELKIEAPRTLSDWVKFLIVFNPADRLKKRSWPNGEKKSIKILMRFLWAFESCDTFHLHFFSINSIRLYLTHIYQSQDLVFIVHVDAYESAIILLCWTFKSAGHELIDELFRCFFITTENERRKKSDLNYKLSRWISKTV